MFVWLLQETDAKIRIDMQKIVKGEEFCGKEEDRELKKQRAVFDSDEVLAFIIKGKQRLLSMTEV